MSRPGYFYRPRLRMSDDRRAWELLMAVPNQERVRFLTRAILQTAERRLTEDGLREILREELSGIAVSPLPAALETKAEESVKNDIPQGMLDFLGELMNQ